MPQLVVLKISTDQIIPHVENIMTTNIYITFTIILTFIICHVISCDNNYIIVGDVLIIIKSKDKATPTTALVGARQ